jgi:molybdate transport system substrate-binding protein
MNARRMLPVAAIGAVIAIAATQALTRGDTRGGGPDVLAAASLAAVAAEVDPRAGVRAAGSDRLAFQIEHGISADVFLSADPGISGRLHQAGHIGRPVAIAGNRLVMIVPVENPAGIARAEDLATPGIRLIVGTPSVPVGAYARQALARMGLVAALDNVASEEPDPGGIVAKVALGEVDAGIVYATDAASAGRRVTAIPVPDVAQPAIIYTAAVPVRADDPDRGRAFIARMRSGDGQRVLRAKGFTVPTR